MNENGGIYGGCFDCEDCKEQNLYCEDCSMYEYDKYRLSNQENNSMNKRQKKKLFKQTLIKVRKLYPQKGDVICFQPDLDWIDAETMCQFMKVYSNNDVFGESKLAFVPADIKQLRHKRDAQIYINKLQSIVDQMGE